MAQGYVTTGTAKPVNGSKVVTFTGVSVSLLRPGNPFNQAGYSGTIDSVDADANAVTLVENWAGGSPGGAGAAYSVITIPESAELAQSTRTIMQYLDGPLLSIAEMTGDASPADGDTLVWDTGIWAATNSPAFDLTSCTGLPVSSGISGLGSGVAALLAGASSGSGGIAGTTTPSLHGTVQIVIDSTLTDAVWLVDTKPAAPSWKFGPGTGGYGLGFYQSTSSTIAGGFGSDGSFLLGNPAAGGFSGGGTAAFERNAVGRPLTLYQKSSGGDGLLIRVDNSSSAPVQFSYQGSFVGSITTDGSQVSYNGTSDRALKMAAQPLTSTAVLEATMYRGDWIGNADKEWVGGIADEMGLLVPEGYAPSTTPFLAPHQDGYVPDAFDYSKWVPHLIVQDQAAWQRLDALEARLAAAGIA